MVSVVAIPDAYRSCDIAARIDIGQRLVTDVAEQVAVAGSEADRVFLCEPATDRVVEPCPVVVETEFRDPFPTGEREPVVIDPG